MVATLGVMTGEDVPGEHERRRRWTTALGDDVNDAARIEACANGGLTLASKHLIERLNPDAADELDLDFDRISYTRLGVLTTPTGKA
jgi:class 3 adenylate cyclase